MQREGGEGRRMNTSSTHTQPVADLFHESSDLVLWSIEGGG